jgi:hypothetical protein
LHLERHCQLLSTADIITTDLTRENIWYSAWTGTIPREAVHEDGARYSGSDLGVVGIRRAGCNVYRRYSSLDDGLDQFDNVITLDERLEDGTPCKRFNKEPTWTSCTKKNGICPLAVFAPCSSMFVSNNVHRNVNIPFNVKKFGKSGVQVPR